MSEQVTQSNEDWYPLKKLTPEETSRRLADKSVSWVKRTRGILYDQERKPLTPEEEDKAIEIAVVNDFLAKDARNGIEHQGLLL